MNILPFTILSLSVHYGHTGTVTGLSLFGLRAFPGLVNLRMAHAVEERLLAMGCRAFVLDGDNVWHGLCGDLGFSLEDRAEHIGRSLKWSSFSGGLGGSSLPSLIFPLAESGLRVRDTIGPKENVEIYCDGPLEICEKQDVKGHYQKDRAGGLAFVAQLFVGALVARPRLLIMSFILGIILVACCPDGDSL